MITRVSTLLWLCLTLDTIEFETLEVDTHH